MKTIAMIVAIASLAAGLAPAAAQDAHYNASHYYYGLTENAWWAAHDRGTTPAGVHETVSNKRPSFANSISANGQGH